MKSYFLPPPGGIPDVWECLQNEARPLLVWGMGNGADKLLRVFGERDITVSDFVASDGFVRGQSFHGRRVLSFVEAREKYASPVVVMAFGTSRPDVLAYAGEIAGEFPLLIPDLPVAGETLFDAAYYAANYEALCAVRDLFADETSRSLFAALVIGKLTGDYKVLMDAWTDPAETAELLDIKTIKTYIDVGAYRGDTLTELVGLGAPLVRAICVEPDIKNFRKLEQMAAALAPLAVTCIQAAAWDREGTGCFFGSGNRNASLCNASFENRPADIPLVRIDTLAEGLAPDYIKYDTEGAEEPGLLGAALTIRRARPRLRVAAYHRTEDLIRLPNMLAELYPGASLFLRRKRCLPAWETDIIVLPKGDTNDG